MPLLTNTYDLARATGREVPVRIAVEVMWDKDNDPDDDASWFDLNKYAPAVPSDKFYNRLLVRNGKLQAPQIKQRPEKWGRIFTPSSFKVLLDDQDAAFGYSLPWTVYDLEGTERQLLNYYRARVRIRCSHRIDSATPTWTSVVHGMIDDIQRDSGVATMTVIGMERMLQEVSPEEIRRGDSWPINARIPDLVKMLVSTGSEGRMEFESGSPQADCSLGSNAEVFTPLGNVPTNIEGEWNERKDFIPLYEFEHHDEDWQYLLGYRISDNKPYIWKWDRENDTWAGMLLGSEGWRLVFGCMSDTYNSSYIYVIALGNRLAYPMDSVPRNEQMIIYKLNATTLANAQNWPSYTVYLPTAALLKPFISDTWYRWGSLDILNDLPMENVPSFFPSHVGASGYGSPVYIYAQSNGESGTGVPIRAESPWTEIASGDADAAFPDWPFSPGYYAAKTSQSGNRPNPMRSPYHTMAYEAFKYDETRHAFYWMRWYENSTHTTGEWQLCRFEINGQLYSNGQDLDLGGTQHGTVNYFYERLITAWDLKAADSVSGRLWVACVDQYPDVDTSEVHLFELALNSGDTDPTYLRDMATLLGIEWSDEYTTPPDRRSYAPMIVAIRHTPSSYGTAFQPIWGMVVNKWAAGHHCYGLWSLHTDSSPGGEVYHKTRGDGGPYPISTAPFMLGRQYIRAGSLYHTYVADQATGRVYDVAVSPYGSMVVDPLAYGEACDAENTWQSCNPLYDTTRDRIVGVSASTSPADTRVPTQSINEWGSDVADYAGESPGGRITLWQYAITVSDVIPVADFGKYENCWDALRALRQRCGDFVMGLNADGDFFFKQRPATPGTISIKQRGDLPVVPDGNQVGCERMKTRLDNKSIINRVSAPAYIGERKTPEVELLLTAASTADGIAVQAQYAYFRAQRIVLVCIRGGCPPADDSTTVPLLFAWRRSFADLTTQLSAAMSTQDYTAYVYGLYQDPDGTVRLGEGAIRIGDTILIGDGDARTIDSINVAAGSIRLNNRPYGTATHPIGTAVRIIPQDKYRYGDSSDGICMINSPITIDPNSPGNKTIYVDDTTVLRPGMVVYRDTAYMRVVEVRRDGWVVLNGPILGVGGGQSVSWSSGDLLRAAIWVEKAGVTYSIADTGVAFSMTPPAVGSDNIGEFAVGDRVIITCHGMGITKLEQSVTVVQNNESISKYGVKSDDDAFDNPFLSPASVPAVFAALDYWWEARYDTVCSGLPFITVFEPGLGIVVRNKYLFPDETFINYGYYHIIVGREIDMRTMTMIVYARSTPGYAPTLPIGDDETAPDTGTIHGHPVPTARGRRR